MGLVKMEIEIPESLLGFIDYQDPNYSRKIIEFMTYQAIKDNKLSFGKAAELLGMDKLTFIQDLSELGIAYFDMEESELQKDIDAINRLLGAE